MKKIVKCILQKIAYKYNRNIIIPVVQNISKNKLLDGKVALVIGGAGDIGGTIVDTFIRSGCKVVDRKSTRLNSSHPK